MTHSRPTVSSLLDDHGLAPRRDLGQNFVVDPNTVRRIAELARVGPGDRVVEIGAGLGSLTLALAETGAEITAIEVDRGIVPVLRDVTAGLDHVHVVEADATELDWASVAPPRADDASLPSMPSDDWVLVGNLPYNVATPLVCDVLDAVPQVTRMLVMVQREVAERFCAAPRSPAYGAVSVKIAFHGRARVVAYVPASVFLPRPKVESALVEVTRSEPADVDADALFALVRRAFGQRRKMLRRSLADTVDADRFERAGIAPTARPEELDVDAWVRLTRELGS